MKIHPKIGLMLASAAILVGFTGLSFVHATDGNADISGYTMVGEDAETGTSDFWVQLETPNGEIVKTDLSHVWAVPPKFGGGLYHLYGVNDGNYILTAFKHGYKCTPVTVTISNGTGQSIDIICKALTGAIISGNVTKLRGATSVGVNAVTVTVKSQGGGAGCPAVDDPVTVGVNDLPATGRSKNDGGYWVSVPYYSTFHNNGCLMRVRATKTGANNKVFCVWNAHDVTWPANSTDVITVNFGPADCQAHFAGSMFTNPYAAYGSSSLAALNIDGGSWSQATLNPAAKTYTADVDLDDANTDVVAMTPTDDYQGSAYICTGETATDTVDGQGENRTLGLMADCISPTSSPSSSPSSSPTP